jgi:hypothetical protein
MMAWQEHKHNEWSWRSNGRSAVRVAGPSAGSAGAVLACRSRHRGGDPRRGGIRRARVRRCPPAQLLRSGGRGGPRVGRRLLEHQGAAAAPGCRRRCPGARASPCRPRRAGKRTWRVVRRAGLEYRGLPSVTESTASARSLGQQRPAEPGWPLRQRKPDGTASCAGGRRPLLHSWFPQVEDCTIEGVGHLLHIQRPQPVAQAMAEFLAWNPMTGT